MDQRSISGESLVIPRNTLPLMLFMCGKLVYISVQLSVATKKAESHVISLEVEIGILINYFL